MADDLARARRDLPAIFGVELGHVDPLAIDFQVTNAIFPFGDAIVEVMAPVGQASAQAGSPPHRSHFCTLPVSAT